VDNAATTRNRRPKCFTPFFFDIPARLRNHPVMRIYVVWLTAWLLLGTHLAQAQFAYFTNGSAISITGYSGLGGAVTISNFVTSIGANAFYDCASLDSVIIPNSVTSIGANAFYLCSGLSDVPIPTCVTNIGDYAFGDCTSLTNIIIPDSVTSIGDGAFSSCGLTSLTIPTSVTSIGDDAFGNCWSMSAINVDTNNPAYMSIGGALFSKDGATLVAFPAGNDAASYSIPTNVTNIGDYAFHSCTSLTNVTIPNSVTRLGSGAFYYCGSLIGVTIPDNLTRIGEDVFGNCWSMSTINVDTNNPTYASIGGVLFSKNRATLVAFPAGNAATSFSIPNSVTNIGDYAFNFCTRLTNITILNTVANIGEYAFYCCISLTGVRIPNSVTNIGDYAFCNSGLTNVTIPDSITAIGDYAFYYCTRLTNITIPNSVANIGDDALGSCWYLPSITIPNSVTNIGSYAFNSCTRLSSVYFLGNAPSADSTIFSSDNYRITAYYLPGTTGWAAFSQATGTGTAPWTLPSPVVLDGVKYGGPSLGVQSNAFGFTVSWATNKTVVVQTATNLANPSWQPLQTNTLTASADGGWFYFSDPMWSNYPAQFYRLASQ
jgi:hypothetical protein